MKKFAEGMKKHFGVTDDVLDFLDPMMSVIKGEAVLNIFALDDWLHEKYGEYEEKEQSMNDIIHEKFGALAVKFVEDHM